MADEEGRQGSSLILKVVLVVLLVLAVLDLGVAVFMRSTPFVMPKAAADAVSGGVQAVANMVGLGGLLGTEPEIDIPKPAKTKAEILFAEGKDTQAIEEWKRELALPEAGTGVRAAEVHNNIGRAYLRLKDYANAREHHRSAIKADPTGGRAYYGLGAVDHREKDLRGARKNYKRAIELNFRTPEVYFNLGSTHLYYDEFESGVEAFKTVVRLDPSFEGAHLRAGSGYEAMGMLDAAEDEFRREATLGNQLAKFAELEAMRVISRRGPRAADGPGLDAEALLAMGKGFRDLTRGAEGSARDARVPRALDAFYRLLALEPSRAGVNLKIGEIYESMDLPQYAAREFRAELGIKAASPSSAPSDASSALARVGGSAALPPVGYSRFKPSSLAGIVRLVTVVYKGHEGAKPGEAAGLSMYKETYRIRLALASYPVPVRERTSAAIELYSKVLKVKNPEQTMTLVSKQIGMYSHELRLTQDGKDVVLVFWSPAASRIMRETWPAEVAETGATTQDAARAEAGAEAPAETATEIRPRAGALLDLYVTLGVFDNTTETTYLFVDEFNYDDNRPDSVL